MEIKRRDKMKMIQKEENPTAIPDTGDKCTECNNGRIALMSVMIGECDMDDEPYTSGVKEGNNDTITLDDYITLTVCACDNCGYVYTKWIE